MPNLPNNPFTELRNLETRVDQRLELLTRAETNLKALLESLRQQVSEALPVADRLSHLVPELRQSADKAATLPSLGELSAALAVGVDQARDELETGADRLRKQMIDELRDAVEAGKNTLAALGVSRPSEGELNALVETFRQQARGTLDAVRESLADELGLLPADAKLRLETLLGELDSARRSAEAAVRSAADQAADDMRRRAETLRQSIDDIAGVLEDRLTQRTAALHQRAEAAMNALQPAMDARLGDLLSALENTLVARERDMVARIDAYPQRLDRQLADTESALIERLARTERHAVDMTAYLESKLVARVDELIARQRLKLQKELGGLGEPRRAAADVAAPAPVTPAVPAAPAVPVAPSADAQPADRPALRASVFVGTLERHAERRIGLDLNPAA